VFEKKFAEKCNSKASLKIIKLMQSNKYVQVVVSGIGIWQFPFGFSLAIWCSFSPTSFWRHFVLTCW
jgi:hypothetical protein